MNVFRIGAKDDQCARLADLHILDRLARGVKLDIDGEHADERAVAHDSAAERHDGLAVGSCRRGLRHHRLVRVRRRSLVPLARARIVSRREVLARLIAAVRPADIGGSNARQIRDVGERCLQRLALGHRLAPGGRRRIDHGGISGDDLVNLVRIVLAKLVHALLLGCRQRRARHHVDGDAHDDKNHDERHTDPQKHLGL